MVALRRAAGRQGRWSMYFVNIYSVASGGVGGGFAGVGNGKQLGIFNHELGHALGLPHWGETTIYPYRGAMFGIPAPASFNNVHVGPTWAFDQAKGVFLTPVVGPQSVGGVLGTYKNDPMQGGGMGDQEKGYLMRPFSDYSVNRMRSMLEGHVVAWNDALGEWAAWDPKTAAYTATKKNDGVSFPTTRDVDVISVMASSSALTSEANIVYPTIGPYTAGLTDLFDPSSPTDRARAAAIYCPAQGCDVSVRVTQGDQIRTYMLPIAHRTDVAACSADGWGTAAINLPASAGDVSRVELLLTPDAQAQGLPANPTVLSTWQK
jgi:hypothetical protein